VRGIPQSLELRVMFIAVLCEVRDGSRFVLVSEPRLFQQLKEPSQLRVTKGCSTLSPDVACGAAGVDFFTVSGCIISLEFGFIHIHTFEEHRYKYTMSLYLSNGTDKPDFSLAYFPYIRV